MPGCFTRFPPSISFEDGRAEQCRFAALPNLAYSLAQTFDLADNRLSMVMNSPHDYVQTSFAYDMLNRLTTNTAWTLGKTVLGAYAYNPNGKLASRGAWFDGNDAGAITYSYDSEQRLQSINGTYNGAQLLGLSYFYNNAQQITAIEETLDGTTVQCGYSYDARDQLVSETRDGSVRSYAYDRAQNRITNSAAGTAETYGYTAANKLSNVFTGVAGANNRYFYDRAGNLQYRVVNNVTNWYDYNAQNKLARIRGGGFTNEFLYDSLNRRVALCQNGTWRYEAHDGAVPVGSFHATRILTRWYVRGVGIAEGTGDVIAEVDMSDRCPSPAFYFSNHRGDTQVCLDGYGQVVAKYRYDAFGNVASYKGTFTPRYTFSSKEYLSDAKLYLYAYRVYDPQAGRWTQRDPIDYQDSLNLYQFCGNNPVNFWDATGCVIWNQFWKGIGAMATGVGMMVVGGGILVGTAPTVAGAAAGAGLVVAGHYPVVMGLGKTIAALNDKPLDIPATGGDLAGKGAASAAKACGASQTSTTAIQEGVGLAVDSALSGGIKSPASVSAFTKPVSTIGDTATGVAAIRETTEQAKNEISKLNEKKHDQ